MAPRSRPICGKPLRAYRLNRPRPSDYGVVPVCGLPAGHPPERNHLAVEVVERLRARRKEKRDWGNEVPSKN